MAVIEIEALKGAAAGGAIAGLDLGEKTIGVAVSDRSYASPILARSSAARNSAWMRPRCSICFRASR